MSKLIKLINLIYDNGDDNILFLICTETSLEKKKKTLSTAVTRKFFIVNKQNGTEEFRTLPKLLYADTEKDIFYTILSS